VKWIGKGENMKKYEIKDTEVGFIVDYETGEIELLMEDERLNALQAFKIHKAALELVRVTGEALNLQIKEKIEYLDSTH
jgi:hypothetical protein